MLRLLPVLMISLMFSSCAAKSTKSDASDSANIQEEELLSNIPQFNEDSAFRFLEKQVDFGPRVPGTVSHQKAADWICAELRRHDVSVIEQFADLTTFDGKNLRARNIFGQINPNASERILLLAHYDCRPWADQDPDPDKRNQPVDGANDGASGVAVLLETARVLKTVNASLGIDLLFVDVEDWGSDGDDDSWAMGTRYFAENPPAEGYAPKFAILLDMVGGKDAKFPHEYFSRQAAPHVADAFFSAAQKAGYGSLFPQEMGGAVTDDHVELIKQGIPAIDIIEYHRESGFNPHWHTASDNLDNISKYTLKAVGQSLLTFLFL